MKSTPHDPSDRRSTGEVTLALAAATNGDSDAQRTLFDALHGELRRIAEAHLVRERVDHTLQPTALVNEAWLKLVDQSNLPVGGRAHFLSVASAAMRRILVDHARSRRRDKRGGGALRVELGEEHHPATAEEEGVDLGALDEHLTALQAQSERQAKVVELRFFGGLTPPEVAETMGLSLSTVEREWRFARAWLLSRMSR